MTEWDLSRSEKKYRLLAENATDMIWTMDMDLRLTYVSPSVQSLRGYTAEETIAQKLEEIFTPSSMQITLKTLEEELAEERKDDKDLSRARTLELEFLCKDGSTTWSESAITFLRDSDAQAIGLIGVSRDITERKRAEEELKAFEKRFSSLAERSFDIIFMTDAQDYLTYISAASERIFHYKPEEMVGKHFKNYLIESEIPRVSQRFAENMQGRNLGILPMEAMRKDGSHVFVELNSSPIVRDGETIGIQGIIRDITGRKRAEEAVRKERDKAQKYLDVAGVMLVAIDVEGRVGLVNKKGCEILGYKEEEIIGKNWFDNFLPQRVKHQVRGVCEKLVSGGADAPEYCENLILTKDGDERLMAWHNTVLRDNKGEVIATLGSGEDITEKKKAEKELSSALAWQKAVFEGARDAVFISDADSRFVMVNRAACELIGFPKDELLGMRIPDVHEQEDLTAYNMYHDRIMAGEEIVSEARILRKDGTKVDTEFNSRCINISGTVYMHTVARDITERKRAEEVLKKTTYNLNERIKELNCLYGLSELVEKPNISLKEIFQGMANLIPLSWQYPDVTCARIIFENDQFKTDNFKITKWKQSADIKVHETKTGAVEVYYLQEKPESYEGPFLKEERDLIEALAERLGRITERKKAEETLKSERDFAESLINTTQAIVLLLDPEGRIKHFNPYMEQISGYQLEEVKGKDWFTTFLPKRERKRVRELFSRASSGIQTRGSINLIVTKNGRELEIEWYDKILRDTDGNVVGLLATGQDITERKRAEEALRRSQKDWENTFNAISDWVVLMNLKGRILCTNRAGEEFVGVPVAEIPGQTCCKLVHGSDTPLPGCPLLKMLQSGRSENMELQLPDSNRWLAITVDPVIDEKGTLAGAVHITRDITERRHAEDERESTIKLLHLINTNNQVHELMKVTMVFLKDWSDCEAVGIRLQEGDDFPYFETSGFPEDFILAENKLCSVNELGEIERDSQGKPYLECMCGNIISGRFDPSKPFFTEHGSFWTNSTTEFLAGTTEADRLARTRNRCNTAGYESMALVPLRVGKETFGLLQFNDKHKGRFTPEKISLLERLADNLAIGLAQRRAEKALRQSEERFRTVADFTYDWEYWISADKDYIYVSPSCERITKYRAVEFQKNPGLLEQITHPDDRSLIAEHLTEELSIDEMMSLEFRIITRNGEHLWIEHVCQPVYGPDGRYLGRRASNRDITERRKAEEKLFDYQAKLKSLASQLSLIEERERHRLATDLHDQIGQALAISKMKLDSLRESVSSGKSADVMGEVSDCLGQIVQDTRTLTFDLSSPILYELGFEAAVTEWLDEQIREKYGIKTDFEDDGQTKPLDDDIRVLLFRNVRELLVNVVKHANAKNVKVSIRKVDDRICVSVEDDGVGFDVTEVESMVTKKAKFGLFSIRERLEDSGGHLEIESEPGHGSRITMVAPLKSK